MIIDHYEINKYKNIIEGNLCKLLELKKEDDYSLESFDTKLALREEIFDALTCLQNNYFRYIYQSIFDNSNRKFVEMRMLTDAKCQCLDALDEIKTFIEENVADDDMDEFTFILYMQVIKTLKQIRK